MAAVAAFAVAFGFFAAGRSVALAQQNEPDSTATAPPPFKGERRIFEAMRATVDLQIPDDSGSSLGAQELANVAEAAVRKTDRLLAPLAEDSDVGRFNRAPENQWVVVDSLTMTATREAARWNQATDGLFEPTIESFKRLYRFEGRQATAWPTEAELAQAKRLVGLDKVLIDPVGLKLAKTVEGVSLDLGGLAKGLAADLAAEALRSLGVRHALLNVGGEMRVLGRNVGLSPPGPWTAALKDPLGRDVRFVVKVSERGLASSGNYERWFERDGRRWSHVIDPRTGRPLPDVTVGATVVHPDSAAAADALATALSVMGLADARAFLKNNARLFPRGLEAALFLKEGMELETVWLSLDAAGELTETRP
ncbi:MAG: FAD:protein FMN transferase [Deltaproteobacteria bacterium]|jgi:thiamine biosynthesis lipoprotein|nr:FAD:protein FMN transferase [Deltaproteobacteria bacterium]